MLIRPEREFDFDAIDGVVQGAFAHSGRDGVEERELVRNIRKYDTYVPKFALVADEDGEIVGHIMLSYVFLGPERTRVLQLSPLAVRPDRQNEQIGDALSRDALQRADEAGEPLVLVLGIPAYYPRFGFEPARTYGIEPPVADIPDGPWMIKRLTNYDATLTGTVDFGPPFAGTPGV